MYEKRNHYTFGLGTIGRDMLYTMVTMYLMFYLTDIVEHGDKTLWWVTAIIVFARIFDALNDPVMGVIVDNTRSKMGKFKPWIIRGALGSALFTVLLFTDFQLRETPFILFFFFVYLAWGISYTANDIAFWSMLPALTVDQQQREKIGAFARICANVGLFSVVVGIVPVTHALGEARNSMTEAYFILILAVSVLMLMTQSITLFGVKEPRDKFAQQPKTSLKELVRVIFKNDQLLWVALSLALFMIGYLTTTSFGLYYFKYIFGNEEMYALFAAVLGASQLTALLVFPLFSKWFNRRKLYGGATILVVLGYLLFFFAPLNMLYIGAAGVLIFLGQAFIQLLMMMFLADTIEYGHWKLGKRNESITFSLQPFVYKLGGALASGTVGAIVILSGVSEAQGPADMTASGILLFKIAMLLVPLLLIVIGFFIYRSKYVLNEKKFTQIVEELKQRGEIRE